MLQCMNPVCQSGMCALQSPTVMIANNNGLLCFAAVWPRGQKTKEEGSARVTEHDSNYFHKELLGVIHAC